MTDLTDDLTNLVRDAAYVGVGAGVIAFQKAQVKRVELTELLKEQADVAKVRADGLGDRVEALVGDLRGRIEGVIASIDADDVVTDVKAGFEGLSTTVEDRIKVLEGRLDAIEDRFESLVDEIEGWLPEQAKDLVKQFREAAKDARQQVRSALGTAA
ncbi:MAG: hypothetical protein GXY13_07170 [Acidimicrobiales bacterium]|nr:hypothetical protein [Acidimicrobiales bacterium]